MKLQSIAAPELNLAQRILTTFGCGYASSGTTQEPAPKRRKSGYGENLRAHFARRNLDAIIQKRAPKGN